MKLMQIAGLVLIAAGTAGLVYGQFDYTKDKSDVSFGPIEFTVREKESVKIPPWLSIGFIALGSLLLVIRTKR